MLPLVGLAATLVPEIIRLIAGDKAGTIAGTVAQTVAQITGTNDPIAAKQKLESDVSVAVALQQKLAEIALEAAKAQNAELANIGPLSDEELRLLWSWDCPLEGDVYQVPTRLVVRASTAKPKRS